jgi:parallel beta-helix repeat protein
LEEFQGYVFKGEQGYKILIMGESKMDKKPLIGKCLAIGIILIFVGTCIIPAIAQDTEKSQSTSRGNWLYVGGSGPGNYTRIQDAINAAESGDTIFIYDDSSPYYENLFIDKSIVVRGENWNTTVINGSGCQTLVTLHASLITVQDLTFEDCQTAVDTYEVQGFKNIFHNNFIGMTEHGIQVRSLNNNVIVNNCFRSIQGEAIHSAFGLNNTIVGNLFEGNANGVLLADKNSVFRNNRVKNTSGFSLITGENNIFIENNIFVNNGGVYPSRFDDNQTVRNNTLIKDGFFVGHNLIQFSNNTVNGKPVIYSYKASNLTYDQPAGQILVVRGSNITVRNQNLSETTYGLILSMAYKCTVENVIACRDNAYGLYIDGSDNTITNCTVTHSGNGIYIYGDRIYVTNCTITQVQGAGVEISGNSDYNYVGYCNVKNAEQGIYAYGCNDGVIEHCTIENATQNGTFITGSRNQVSYTSLKNNRLGVYWEGLCYVKHNDFIGNNQSAKFHMGVGCRPHTQWLDNYWEHPQSKPKIILGKRDFILLDLQIIPITVGLTIPFLGIDFSPAQSPHSS